MALKVFLVEDESVVREGLRDNIPWQQFGYQFVGEAGDGEMALPLIRKTRPDVLITDIKMPFMDGLTLSHIVGQEFPEMNIIIISGYDDFEYARQAIREGVAGKLSVQEIYEEAQKHSLDINAPFYNLVLIDVQEKANKQQAGEACQKCYEELMRFLMRFSSYYLVFRWNISIYGIMIKGEKENIAERTDKCLEGIEQICVQYEEETNW